MFKLLYRNLLANWRRNIWLLLQISIIAYFGWMLLDPVLVKLYAKHRDPGYDIERLVQLNLSEYPVGSASQPEKVSDEEKFDHLNRILTRIRNHKDVEAATLANMVCFEQMSTNSSSMTEDDYYILTQFIPGTDFFKTFGLKDVSTGTPKEFVEPPMTENHAVISKTIADFIFPGENPIGQFVEKKSPHFEKYKEYAHTVSGIVNDAVYRSVYGRTPIVYQPLTVKTVIKRGGIPELFIVIRLKDGIDPATFAASMGEYISHELKSGPVYAHSPKVYTDNRRAQARDTDNMIITNGSLALFFFVNVFLGMLGTFYLQTRKRSMDAGIIRSFGGSKGFVIREMIAEGIIIVTIACVIAFAAYYKMEVAAGNLTTLDGDGNYSAAFKAVMPMWFDNSMQHFLTVSGIIYAILLLAVVIGIYIPARRISRILPVEALRDID